PGEMPRDRNRHLLEHRRRQAPGIGVVAAAVIAVEQPRAALDGVLGAVAERVSARAEPERAQGGVMRDAAEREDGRARGKRGQLGRQIRVALPNLRRLRLVSGWQGLDRVGYADVAES